MAKQRYLNTKFWSDSYIQGLSKDPKLFYLYLLTNEHTNIAGIYEVSIRSMCFESGLSEEEVLNSMDTLSRDKKVFYAEGYVILCNFPKHQDWEKSSKIRQGIDAILQKLPRKVMQSVDTLSIPYTYPSNYLNLNSNLNTNSNSAANAENNMGYEEFNDGEVTYEDDNPPKGAKRDKGRKKIYGTFVMHYMKITNKKGNVLQFFPAARDIYELCIQEFPNYSNEQILAEITRRIDLANDHYNRLEMKDWGLMKLVAHWSNVLGWKVKDAPQEADVSARRKL